MKSSQLYQGKKSQDYGGVDYCGVGRWCSCSWSPTNQGASPALANTNFSNLHPLNQVTELLMDEKRRIQTLQVVEIFQIHQKEHRIQWFTVRQKIDCFFNTLSSVLPSPWQQGAKLVIFLCLLWPKNGSNLGFPGAPLFLFWQNCQHCRCTATWFWSFQHKCYNATNRQMRILFHKLPVLANVWYYLWLPSPSLVCMQAPVPAVLITSSTPTRTTSEGRLSLVGGRTHNWRWWNLFSIVMYLEATWSLPLAIDYVFLLNGVEYDMQAEKRKMMVMICFNFPSVPTSYANHEPQEEFMIQGREEGSAGSMILTINAQWIYRVSSSNK